MIIDVFCLLLQPLFLRVDSQSDRQIYPQKSSIRSEFGKSGCMFAKYTFTNLQQGIRILRTAPLRFSCTVFRSNIFSANIPVKNTTIYRHSLEKRDPCRFKAFRYLKSNADRTVLTDRF